MLYFDKIEILSTVTSLVKCIHLTYQSNLYVYGNTIILYGGSDYAFILETNSYFETTNLMTINNATIGLNIDNSKVLCYGIILNNINILTTGFVIKNNSFIEIKNGISINNAAIGLNIDNSKVTSNGITLNNITNTGIIITNNSILTNNNTSTAIIGINNTTCNIGIQISNNSIILSGIISINYVATIGISVTNKSYLCVSNYISILSFGAGTSALNTEYGMLITKKSKVLVVGTIGYLFIRALNTSATTSYRSNGLYIDESDLYITRNMAILQSKFNDGGTDLYTSEGTGLIISNNARVIASKCVIENWASNLVMTGNAYAKFIFLPEYLADVSIDNIQSSFVTSVNNNKPVITLNNSRLYLSGNEADFGIVKNALLNPSLITNYIISICNNSYVYMTNISIGIKVIDDFIQTGIYINDSTLKVGNELNMTQCTTHIVLWNNAKLLLGNNMVSGDNYIVQIGLLGPKTFKYIKTNGSVNDYNIYKSQNVCAMTYDVSEDNSLSNLITPSRGYSLLYTYMITYNAIQSGYMKYTTNTGSNFYNINTFTLHYTDYYNFSGINYLLQIGNNIVLQDVETKAIIYKYYIFSITDTPASTTITIGVTFISGTTDATVVTDTVYNILLLNNQGTSGIKLFPLYNATQQLAAGIKSYWYIMRIITTTTISGYSTYLTAGTDNLRVAIYRGYINQAGATGTITLCGQSSGGTPTIGIPYHTRSITVISGQNLTFTAGEYITVAFHSNGSSSVFYAIPDGISNYGIAYTTTTNYATSGFTGATTLDYTSANSTLATRICFELY
jgi:hypothetical protein